LQENQTLKDYIVDVNSKIEVFKDKESKMIKLLIAIKNRGIDIDKIYNSDVLNEQLDESSNSELNEKLF
jgi:hypothetical protein